MEMSSSNHQFSEEQLLVFRGAQAIPRNESRQVSTFKRVNVGHPPLLATRVRTLREMDFKGHSTGAVIERLPRIPSAPWQRTI